jgi:hypothetical protein
VRDQSDWIGEESKRDEAMRRVKENPANGYDYALNHALGRVLLMPPGGEFVTSDLFAGYDLSGDPRVTGPIVRKLSTMKLIVATGKVSTEGRSHKGVARVWKRSHGRV